MAAGILALALGADPALAQVTGDDPAHVELALKRALGARPEDFEANHRLGEFYVQHGRPAEAVPYLEKALGIRDTAELRSLLGGAFEKAGNLLAAAEEYQRAAHMDPTEDHLFDWGDNLLQLRAYVPATQVLTEAVRRYPRSARLNVALGIAQYSRGQFQDAVRSFCTAADLDPVDPRPYSFLGEMYGVSPEMADEVTRRLAHFVSAHPKDALGQFHYAMSLWKGRPDGEGKVDLAEVEKRLQTAVTLDPALARAHFQMGVLFVDQRRYAEAVAALQRAVRLEPGMAQAHYRLGQVYRRMGQEELAEKELEVFQRLQESEAPQGPSKENP